jgi:hypothetical protein
MLEAAMDIALVGNATRLQQPTWPGVGAAFRASTSTSKPGYAGVSTR